MDTNEIITTAVEEVVEATEEIATACSDNFGKGVVVGSVATFVSVLAYDFVIKPLARKIKAKMEQRRANSEACEAVEYGDSCEMSCEAEN